MVIKTVVVVCLVLIVVFLGGWALDHYFGISYHPKINGPKDVAEQAKVDAERANKDKGNKAWDDHFKNKVSLKETQQKLADEEMLREAREIVAANALKQATKADGNDTGSTSGEAPKQKKFYSDLTTVDCTKTNCTKQLSDDEWEVTVDPRILWQDTGIAAKTGETFEFTPDQTSRVLSPPEAPFGPSGGRHAEFARVSKEDFPVLDAGCIGLISRFGDGTGFGVPETQKFTADQDGNIKVMANVRKPWLNEASGNFKVKITRLK